MFRSSLQMGRVSILGHRLRFVGTSSPEPQVTSDPTGGSCWSFSYEKLERAKMTSWFFEKS